MRIHVSFRVKDLETSERFYSRLLGAEPTVRRHDYAKWSLEEPRVNLSIVKSADAGGLEHLGLEAQSPGELEEMRARAAGAGLENEGEVTCCYARSDKSWLTGPEGVRWELFYTHQQAPEMASAAGPRHEAGGPACFEERAAEAAGTACCEPDCCEERAAEAAGAACCEPGCCEEAGA